LRKQQFYANCFAAHRIRLLSEGPVIQRQNNEINRATGAPDDADCPNEKTGTLGSPGLSRQFSCNPFPKLLIFLLTAYC